MLRMSRVLRGDQFDFFENAQRAQGDVVEIADRRRHDVEGASHSTHRAWVEDSGSKMEDGPIFNSPFSIIHCYFPQSRE